MLKRDIMKNITLLIIAIIMTFGLMAIGQFIKDGLIQIRSADRYVTVKGLAERDVKADLAVWPILYKGANDVLEIAQSDVNRQTALIKQFLKQNGIAESEISVNRITINDAAANQYQNSNATTRYAIDKTILVRTNNVDAVDQASQKIGDLIGEGVLIGYGSIPQYNYTTLNDIKPEMIAAATRNAREAATQFANDSGATVGDIRSASQGYFSINARDDVAGNQDSQSLYKKIRVVSTIEYYLND